MNDKVSIIANVCTIISAIISFIGLISSNNYYYIIIVLAMIILMRIIVILIYKNRKVIIENRIIGMNTIRPKAKLNVELLPQNVIHKCIIDDEQGYFIYNYSGICKVKSGASNIYFNIGAEEYIPFEYMTCYYYDLIKDPSKSVKLRPNLIAQDDMFKTIEIQFANKLNLGEAFSFELHYVFPHCMKYGKCYFSSSLLFKKCEINSFINIVQFKDKNPEYVKRYNIKNKNQVYEKLIYLDEETVENDIVTYTYKDEINKCSGNINKIYFFERNT